MNSSRAEPRITAQTMRKTRFSHCWCFVICLMQHPSEKCLHGLPLYPGYSGSARSGAGGVAQPAWGAVRSVPWGHSWPLPSSWSTLPGPTPPRLQAQCWHALLRMGSGDPPALQGQSRGHRWRMLGLRPKGSALGCSVLPGHRK